MVQGAIHKNESARDYRFRADSTSTHGTTHSVALSSTSRLRILWGKSYSAGVTGIEVKLYSNETSGGVQSQVATLTTPWGTFTVSSATWVSSHTTRVELDDTTLVVNRDCTFTLTFSELRWYVNGTLEETISGKTVTGINFDLRKDVVFLEAHVNEDHPVMVCTDTAPSPLTCALSFAAEPTYSDNVANSVTGGYQWYNGTTWVADSVQLKTVTWPSTTCSCGGTHPTPSETDSYNVTVISDYSEQLSKTNEGNFTCTCPTSGYITWNIWRKNLDALFRQSWVNIIPDSSGIKDHRCVALIECPGDSDTQTTNSTESDTYMEMYILDNNIEVETYCSKVLSSIPCPVGEECTPIPDFENSSCCQYNEATIFWPSDEPCVRIGDKAYAHDLFMYGPSYAAYVSDDNLVILSTYYAVPESSSIAEVTVTATGKVTSPEVVSTPRGIVFASYTYDDSSTYLTFSTDYGRSWSTPSLMLSGYKYVRMAVCPDGTVVFIGFSYVSGSSGPGYLGVVRYYGGSTSMPSVESVVDETGTAIQVADEQFDISHSANTRGQMLLFCKIYGDSDFSFHVSMDFGKSFKQAYP
jgi:hypothetical protein